MEEGTEMDGVLRLNLDCTEGILDRIVDSSDSQKTLTNERAWLQIIFF